MREIRLYGSEGGGAARSPYPYLNFFVSTEVTPPNLRNCLQLPQELTS